jgi:hypothetical protein
MSLKRFNRESKTYKIFRALQDGDRLTPAAAQKRFGVQNLRAEASRIRQMGFAVYAKNYKAGNNVDVTYYVMGEPSREIVALGYKAQSLGIQL